MRLHSGAIRWSWVLIVLSFLCGRVNVACGETPPKIGVILPMSEEMAPFGKIVLEGLKESGLDMDSLIVEDDKCKPAHTAAAYRKLSSVNGVKYIVGPLCGSPQAMLAPLLKKTDQLALIPGSAAENLFSQSAGRVFSAQYSNDAEAKFNAERMSQMGLKRVALVFYEDVFCRTHEAAFRKAFRGDILGSLSFSSLEPGQVKTIALKLKQMNPDGIYVPDVSPFFLGLRTEMHRIGISKIPTVSIFSLQMKDVLVAEGAHANGVTYSYPAVGEDDAISYFPKRTGIILKEIIQACGNDTSCAMKRLHEKHGFNKRGVLNGAIEAKEIREGAFVRMREAGL